MANICRRIGFNISSFMKKAGISVESFAHQFGYTVKDVWNIVEGKVMLPPPELDKISSYLGTTREMLIHAEEDQLVPELQYMNEFTNPDHLDQILDLVDLYVEFKEVV